MDKRALAKAALPRRLFERIVAVRSRRFQKRFLSQCGLLAACEEYIAANGLQVKYGPFARMVYPRGAARGRHVIPKLLGTYEQELHPIIETIQFRRYSAVVDVGSAEGYYAVGLARLLQAPVLAYDPEPYERAWCAEMARLNGVSSLIKLRNLFLPSDIEPLSEKKLLMLCDAEGFEGTLFTRESVLLTGNWDVLLELHGSWADSLPDLPWPQKTSVIKQTPRSVAFSELAEMGKPQSELLAEYRGDRNQCWLWCDSQA